MNQEPDLNNFQSLLEAAQVEDAVEPPDSRDAWYYTLRSTDQILNTVWPESVWAVPDLLPVGLSILAGDPKVGKSWLTLQIDLAVYSGGKIFGERVAKGRTLYMALEDPERRLKSRMLLQGWGLGLQADFLTIGSFADRLGDLRRGVAERLGNRIQEVGYSLVVIDTLSRAIYADQNDNREMTD